jgi:hypothetical protein
MTDDEDGAWDEMALNGLVDDGIDDTQGSGRGNLRGRVVRAKNGHYTDG